VSITIQRNYINDTATIAGYQWIFRRNVAQSILTDTFMERDGRRMEAKE
jgi:hypothetical protein